LALTSIAFEVLAQDTSYESLIAQTESLEGRDRLISQINLADSLYRKSRYTESLKTIELVLANPLLRDFDSLLCEVIFRKGENLLFTSDFDSAIVWLTRSLNNCTDAKNRYKVGKSHLRLGNCYNQIGAFDTAMYYFKEAEVIFSALDDQKSLASLNNSIALLYGDTDQPLKSLDYLLKTLNYFDSLGDEYNLSVIQNNIGLLYSDQQDTVNAFKYYYKSIQNSQATEYDIQLAKTYTNLGNLHSNLGAKDSAFFYYKKSLDISEKTGSKYSLANIHYNLGELYINMENPDSAEYHILKSKALCEALKIYEGLFFCNLGMGNVYELRDDHQKAIDYYHEAHELASSFGIANLVKEASSKLHEAYLKLGDYKNGFRYFKEFHTIHDSLSSVEKDAEFKELTVQYETKLKEEENLRLKETNERNKELLSQQNTYLFILFLVLLVMIVLIFVLLNLNDKYKKANSDLNEQRQNLDNKNVELEKVNAELKEVIQIKDKLMSVISHDLRSPMASLQGLIALLQSQSLGKDEFSQVIKKIETNLLNFSKFSDNILQWVKGQSHGISIKKEKIGLCPLIEEAVNLHARQLELKEIQCEIDCKPGDDYVMADSQTVSIVLRNLISNAIKFSPLKGLIKISLSNKEQGLQCSVSDSGIGMDQNLIEKIHSKKPIMPSAGTSNEKGLGLGLSLCIEFLELNGSELQIESEGGRGTTFSFILPSLKEAISA
jgi:signal transduction histidine kinase